MRLVDRRRRVAHAKPLVDVGDVKREGSIAVGDTFGDVSMLEYSEQPIIFNASHTLTTYGEEFGWSKVFESKDQVTILQKGRKDTPYTQQRLEEFISNLKSN